MMNAESSSASGEVVVAGAIPRMGELRGGCVMLVSNLLLLVILGQTPDEKTDPAALAAQLGSGRYAEREAASESLLRLGRPALPVLREARSSRDMEVRNRAYNLIQRIE